MKLKLCLSLIVALAAPISIAQPAPLAKGAIERIARMTPLFDGKTLEGWMQTPPYATSFSGDDIVTVSSMAKRLIQKPDSVSEFVAGQLDEKVKGELNSFAAASTNARALKSALAKALNKSVADAALYSEPRFSGVPLRPETAALLKTATGSQEVARRNRLLLEDAFPIELSKSPAASWTVKDGAMASLGAGRGVIHTKGEFTHYRLIFTLRHLGGPPSDHAPCVLIFCVPPPPGEKGLDALGGIQFQPPNGGSWDYRPGKNNDGKGLFNRLIRPGFNSKEWHQVELLVNAEAGTARMAVAQPPGSKAIEVLRFKDPSAGRTGPIAWQMHNKGLFDEFKEVRIEIDPRDDVLLTTE